MTRKPAEAKSQTVTKENRKRVAVNFKAARQRAEMTQAEVGEAAGYGENGQGYISRIEAGNQNVTIDRLSALAVIVGTTLQDLLAPVDSAPRGVAPPQK